MTVLFNLLNSASCASARAEITTKHPMSKEKKVIEGKRLTFLRGMSLEKYSDSYRISVSRHENGKRVRTYYPATLEGYKKAYEDCQMSIHERTRLGASFGNISEDEKRTISLWRQYRDNCQASGFSHFTAFEVMQRGLETCNTTSPTFQQEGKLYLDNLLYQENGVETSHIVKVKSRIARISAHFDKMPMHKMSEDLIRTFVGNLTVPRSGAPAQPATKRQYIQLIKSVFSFAVKKKHLDEKDNPTLAIDTPTIEKKEVEIIPLKEIEKLWKHVKNTPALHHFIPALAVGLFCGVRVAERTRMQYKDIFVGGRNEIYLSAAITKNDFARYIYPPACFKQWLIFAESKGVEMTPDNYIIPGATEIHRVDAHSRMIKSLQKAGFTIPKNAIRHTAASNMCVIHGFTEAASQLGHEERILRRHYRLPLTRTEAEAYFAISPETV